MSWPGTVPQMEVKHKKTKMSFLLRKPSFYRSLNNARFFNNLSRTPKIRHFSASCNDGNHVVASPYPDVTYPKNVEAHQVLLEKIATYGDLPAMTCGSTGRTITFSQMYKSSLSFAAALRQLGFPKGSVVALVLPNVLEFAEIMLACWAAGLTVSCVNPAYTPQEIQRQIAKSTAQLVITLPHYLDSVKLLKTSQPGGLSSIIILDSSGGHADCLNYHQMLLCDPLKLSECSSGAIHPPSDTIALLPFSSGTTGAPKGVMLTHSNLVINLFQYTYKGCCPTQSLEALGHQERLIAVLPLFHSYGFTVFIMTGVFQGSHTLVLPKFDAGTFLQAFSSHKPTCVHLVTPLITHIADNPAYTKSLLSSLHTIAGGAAPIGPGLIHKLLDKGTDLFFAEGYGMTELSTMSHFNHRSSQNKKIGSCGRPIPLTLTKLVDASTDKTVGRNERGEVWVTGPQVMKGYWQNPKATQETITPDGWLKTGDIGYYDEDGYLYIVDRIKELIKVKGFQVAPSELEDLLRQHEKIKDCAVIGIPDDASGELPRAYIVGDITEDEVHNWINPQVAKFKWLRGGVEIVPKIPKSPSGKILRRELLAEFIKRTK